MPSSQAPESSGRGVRSVMANSAYLISARLATRVVRTVYVILIARILGPDIYGVFVYAQSWYLAFLPFGILGLGAIIGREVGQAGERAVPILATTLSLRLTAALLVATISAVVGWYLEQDPMTRQLVLVFAFALAGRALAMWSEHIFIAYEKSRYALIQELLFRPLEVIVGIGLLLSGFGVLMLALVHAASWWLQAVTAFGVIQRRLVRVIPDWNPDAMLRLFLTAFPLALSAGLSTWLIQGPVILYRHQPEVTGMALGQVALPLQIVIMLYALPLSVGMAALPILARSVKRQDRRDTFFVEIVSRIAILGGGAAGIIGLAFAQPVAELLFGARYTTAGGFLGPALWLMIPLTMGTAVGPTLIARGQRWSLAWSALVAALLLVVFLPILVKWLGSGGVLWASGLALTAWVLLLYAMLYRDARLNIIRCLLLPTTVTAVCVGVYFGLAPLGLTFAVLVALVLYFPVAKLFGAVTPDELDYLLELLRRR